MTDAPTTEAQQAAARLIAQYGEPKSRETLTAMLARAYTLGAYVATTEILKAAERA